MRLYQPTRCEQLGVYLDRRVAAVRKVVGKLAERHVDGQARRALAALDAADSAVRERILLHPAHHVWWLNLSLALRAGDGSAARRLVSEFPAQVIAGVRCAPPDRVGPVWRFPASLLTDFPGADAGIRGVTGDTVELSIAADGRLVVTGDQGSAAWDPDSGGLDGSLARQAGVRPWRASGGDLRICSSAGWIASFLEYLNVNDAPPGQPRGDRTPGTVSDQLVATIGEAWRLLVEAWPELAADVATYARVIVPVRTAGRQAFTNTLCQGAVFLKEDSLDNVATIVEQLVHEAGHLQLNAEMSVLDLHRHSWDDTVPSPFRAGPRPVTGLFHGAVVFCRSAAALDRVASAAGRPELASAVPELVALVQEALDIIDDQVRLTPAGEALVDEVRGLSGQLRRSWPAAATVPAGADR